MVPIFLRNARIEDGSAPGCDVRIEGPGIREFSDIPIEAACARAFDLREAVQQGGHPVPIMKAGAIHTPAP